MRSAVSPAVAPDEERQTLIARQANRAGWTRTEAQGRQSAEAELKLEGWSRTRRVVLLHRRIRDDEPVNVVRESTQLRLPIQDDTVLEAHEM